MESSQPFTISKVFIKDIIGGELTISAQSQNSERIPNENISINHKVSTDTILTVADEFMPFSLSILPDVTHGDSLVTLSVSNSEGLVSSFDIYFHVQKDVSPIAYHSMKQ